MIRESMIKVLRYKAEHIKTRIKPEFFSEVADTLEKEQRPKGHWERHYSRPNVYADLYWHCSECTFKSASYYANHYRYCPNCGCQMDEVTE